MKRTVDALIIPYARRRTLELVLSLSGYEADKKMLTSKQKASWNAP